MIALEEHVMILLATIYLTVLICYKDFNFEIKNVLVILTNRSQFIQVTFC